MTDIYKDILERTGGDIYIAVAGPCAREIHLYQTFCGGDDAPGHRGCIRLSAGGG